MIPLVTVIMPVRNAARWIDEACESLARQDFDDFECLLIDDGSDDRSPEIMQAWEARDRRFRVVRQQRSGLVAALNRGIAEASGELLARLDADDRAAPQRLGRQVEFLTSHADVGLLGSWARVIDENGRPGRELRPPASPHDLLQALTRGNPLVHSSVMMRAALVRRLGGYRAAFEAAEDYDLWLRMSEAMAVANLPESLVEYRRHGAGVTGRAAIRQAFSVRLAQLAARMRRQSGADPAAGLVRPPDWRSPEADTAFYADAAKLYRLLDWTDSDVAGLKPAADFGPALDRISELSHAERELLALALVRCARARGLRNLLAIAGALLRRPGMALPMLRGLRMT
jgi:glycosyltransferase involved in cell wall biosynthesis